MGDNKKPILSVLVDEDKKRLFADLARAHNYSMGWLLNQAIDKMLEAGTIYIYRDSIAPIDGVEPKPLPSTDIEEVVRRYVDKANESIIDDLLNLQAQVAELTANRDNSDKLRGDVADLQGTMVQVLMNIKGGSTIKTINHNKSTIGTTSTPGGSSPSREVLTVVKRMIADPELKTLAETALAKGLKGKALIDHLFEEGYGANNNSKPFDSSVGSRFQPAIDYLNNGGQANG
jgi:hypothetical protein